MKMIVWLAVLGSWVAAGSAFGYLTPLLRKVPSAVSDRQGFQVSDRVHLDGWVDELIADDVVDVALLPFADAGGTGARYRMWLPLAESIHNPNLQLTGRAGCSTPDFDAMRINDDDLRDRGKVVNAQRAGEVWFAAALKKPAGMRRFVFVHERTERDGSWFDTSGGKPRVQIRRAAGGEWETDGTLADYPTMTETLAVSLDSGQKFASRLPPQRCTSSGVPVCDNRTGNSVVSCSELQAFAE